MNSRDLPEVVAELIIEMHEVRSELNAINGRLDRLDQRMESVEHEIRLTRQENRENTDRLIEALGRSMEPLINRLLDHEGRLGRLESQE